MRKLVVALLLMPALASGEVHLLVSIENSSSKPHEFVGITQIDGDAFDLIVLVTGESKVTSNGSLVGSKPIDYRPPAHRKFIVKEFMHLRKREGTHTYCMEAKADFKRGLSWLRDILEFDMTQPCVTFKGEARPQREMRPTYYRQPSWQYFRLCALYRTCVNGGSNPNTKVVYH